MKTPTRANKVPNSNLPITYVADDNENGFAIWGFETKDSKGNKIQGGRWNFIGRIPRPKKEGDGGGSGKTEETFASDKDFNDLLDALPQHEAAEFRKKLEAQGYSTYKKSKNSGFWETILPSDSRYYEDAIYDEKGSTGDSARYINKNNPKQDTMLHRYHQQNKGNEKKKLFGGKRN